MVLIQVIGLLGNLGIHSLIYGYLFQNHSDTTIRVLLLCCLVSDDHSLTLAKHFEPYVIDGPSSEQTWVNPPEGEFLTKVVDLNNGFNDISLHMVGVKRKEAPGNARINKLEKDVQLALVLAPYTISTDSKMCRLTCSKALRIGKHV